MKGAILCLPKTLDGTYLINSIYKQSELCHILLDFSEDPSLIKDII